MDSARAHNFTFNEAISFMVHCSTQEEIDYFWVKLSADRKAEQCGWLKDKFGLSWQIVPTVMDEMLNDKDETKLARVAEAFLKMKRFDIAKLKEVYGQKGRSAAYAQKPELTKIRGDLVVKRLCWLPTPVDSR
jgi:hypothetical protein